MSLNAELATGTVTTSNVAVITVPAGQLWNPLDRLPSSFVLAVAQLQQLQT
jgi:hypothetical protein